MPSNHSLSSNSSSLSEEFENTIAEDLVVTKYKMAGEIVNLVLKQIVDRCSYGSSVREICVFGDSLLIEETSKVFKKMKEMKKGIAFPTCISVNNCICHFSPLSSQMDIILNEEDLIKIELGAHIDGFMALVAHTLIVGASKDKKVTGKKADVVLAAYYASQAALRLLKPGEEASNVTDVIQRVAEEYRCQPVEGMLSNRLKQFTCDAKKVIIQKPNEAEKQEFENFEFSLYDVYALDVVTSSGSGVWKELGIKESIYKKTNANYQLKLRASRGFFSEVSRKYGNMPFSLRNFENEKTAKLAVNECVNHGLIKPFKVIFEKPYEFVAQFKFSVLLLPSGPHKITGLLFDPDIYQSEFTIKDSHLKTILTTSANPKNMKKNKKKRSSGAMDLGRVGI